MTQSGFESMTSHSKDGHSPNEPPRQTLKRFFTIQRKKSKENFKNTEQSQINQNFFPSGLNLVDC